MLKAQSQASRGYLSAIAITNELALRSRSRPGNRELTQSAAPRASWPAQLEAIAAIAPLRASPEGIGLTQSMASSGVLSAQARAMDTIPRVRKVSGNWAVNP